MNDLLAKLSDIEIMILALVEILAVVAIVGSIARAFGGGDDDLDEQTERIVEATRDLLDALKAIEGDTTAIRVYQPTDLRKPHG